MKGTNKLAVISKAVFYIAIVFFSILFLYKFLFVQLPANFFGVPNWEVFEITPTVGDPGIGLVLGYILLLIAIALIVFFFIKQLIDNPKKTIGSLIGFAIIVVVFLIAWAFSSGDTGEMTLIKVSESTSKLIGGSLGLLYIMGGVAVLSILVTEVWSYFK
jgi:hypothetical protein